MERGRSLYELYTMLYNSIKDLEIIVGLCAEITALHLRHEITYFECERLHSHFLSQKPRRILGFIPIINHKFLSSKAFTGKVYWWNNYLTEESTQQRKLFILHLIHKTK